ncbi:MAG TPA: DUF3306 domain-containing protein [Saliniramus sp.]|nr:DUF3306 domain-containing protein [Saliniramus sp.]
MSGEGFLSRWSKRKQEVAREEVRERDVAPAPETQPDETPPEVTLEAIEPHDPALHDPEAITPEELAALPSVEEIMNPADFSQYLRKGVPQVLRNAAMRRMWMLDPAIRDYVDPALDYAYDWNIPGGVPGNGALAAGFDAKGAAEKFFSTMRGKISNETGEFEQAEAESPISGDISPQEEESESMVPVPAPTQSELGEANQAEKSSQGPASKAVEQDSTLVVVDAAASPEFDTTKQAGQGPARRHGRALPV